MNPRAESHQKTQAPITPNINDAKMLCRTSVQEGVLLCTQPPAAGNDTAVDMMCLEASRNCLHLAIA